MAYDPVSVPVFAVADIWLSGGQNNPMFPPFCQCDREESHAPYRVKQVPGASASDLCFRVYVVPCDPKWQCCGMDLYKFELDTSKCPQTPLLPSRKNHTTCRPNAHSAILALACGAEHTVRPLLLTLYVFMCPCACLADVAARPNVDGVTVDGMKKSYEFNEVCLV